MALTDAGLRSDFHQWLIDDDETLGALMRGLEAMALQMVGQTLSVNRLIQVRALGHFMLRVSQTRLDRMLAADGAQQMMVKHLAKVMCWLAERCSETPAKELDELHAAVFALDAKARSAGMTGPGLERVLVRGD